MRAIGGGNEQEQQENNDDDAEEHSHLLNAADVLELREFKAQQIGNAYVNMFLWLHLYASLLVTVLLCSMHIWLLLGFVALGIAQDVAFLAALRRQLAWHTACYEKTELAAPQSLVSSSASRRRCDARALF
jgi:hypothetical protein